MQKVPNCFYRVAIKALILNEEKRFMLLHEPIDLWDLPGGGIEFGEKPHDCLEKEMVEETGLKLTFISKNPIYFITAINHEGIYIANVIYDAKVENLNFTPSDECDGIKFFSAEEALKMRNLYNNVYEFAKKYK